MAEIPLLTAAADTTSVDVDVPVTGAVISVSAGTADLKKNAITIAALVVGDSQTITRKVANITLVATSAGTTAVMDDNQYG